MRDRLGAAAGALHLCQLGRGRICSVYTATHAETDLSTYGGGQLPDEISMGAAIYRIPVEAARSIPERYPVMVLRRRYDIASTRARKQRRPDIRVEGLRGPPIQKSSYGALP